MTVVKMHELWETFLIVGFRYRFRNRKKRKPDDLTKLLGSVEEKQRLVTWYIEMLQVVLHLGIRSSRCRL
jgi:hypothetical protein